jgi:hypothetical protein
VLIEITRAVLNSRMRPKFVLDFCISRND